MGSTRGGKPPGPGHAADRALLERLSNLAVLRGGETDDALIESAVERASALERATGGRRSVVAGGESIDLVTLVFVADAAVAVAANSNDARAAVRTLVQETASSLEIDSVVLSRAVIATAARSASLTELNARRAVDVQLVLLEALAPIDAASVWLNRSGVIECVAAVGTSAQTRRMRAAAGTTLTGGASAAERSGRVVGIPVTQWQRTVAALVLRAKGANADDAAAIATTVVPALVAALEKDELLLRNAEREQSLVETAERRLVRLGFDLHDGPLQDLAALVAETRLLREQLVRAPSLDKRRPLVIGRLDDFEARALAMETDLRELVQSLEGGTLVHVPFFELIEREVTRFGTSTEITLETRGRPDALTQSQRISLLRVVQEALSNVESHSDATRARVTIVIGSSYLRAEIADDGRGFDAARVSVGAAESGRLGLAGMAERIRLLGGRLDIRSKPGGPTTLTASIPRWYPSHERQARPPTPG